ncbi:MAG: type II toxin-antitoxin system HicB family antitoxin [Sandaracinobacteroides sp.]
MAKLIYRGAVCGQDGSYGVVFPDLPGCTASAASMAALPETAREAVEGHLEVMADFGDAIPSPGQWSLHQILELIDPEQEDEWHSVIDVEVELPLQRTTVSVLVPTDLASEIDAVSGSRSDFVRAAVAHELERLRKRA